MTGKRRRGWPIWLHLVVAILVVALLQGVVIKPYRVPSASMQQTLQPGQVIWADRISYRFAEPKRGDVVVFIADETWLGAPRATVTDAVSLGRWLLGLIGVGPGLDHALVKRVIGLPGETVACCDAQGRLTVNGTAITEAYLYADIEFRTGLLDCATSPRSGRCFDPITVPSGSFLVLGDHRSDSADGVVNCRGGPHPSPCARFVTRESLIGRVP